MSALNPFMNNADYPAFELPKLVQLFGEPAHGQPLTDDQVHIAGAIERHAGNALEVIIGGFGEIGNLMGLIDGMHEVSVGSLNALGSLLKHLATEAEYLRLKQSDMNYLLRVDIDLKTPTTAKAKPGRGGK